MVALFYGAERDLQVVVTSPARCRWHINRHRRGIHRETTELAEQARCQARMVSAPPNRRGRGRLPKQELFPLVVDQQLVCHQVVLFGQRGLEHRGDFLVALAT